MPRRVVDLLAPLGLVVIVGSLAYERAGRTLPGKAEYYLIAGFALILAQLVLRWDDVSRAVGRRQMRYGANTFVLTLVVVGILGALNYIVVRHGKRWDLTKNERFSVSDQTRKVVQGLKDDVTISYFQRKAQMRSGPERMKLYQALSPRLKVEFIDPIANPVRAEALDARGPWPVLVVQHGDRREKIMNDAEQDVTNALIKITHEQHKALCFVQGEGERDVDDSGDRGYSSLKSALGKNQYETQKVFLAHEGKVPAPCTVLVVSGPEKDLLPPAVDAIRTFVKAGGKALILVEPETKGATPNLTALLKEWNLEAGHDVVVDISPMGQLFGTGPLTPIAAQYPYHEITKDFRVMTAFHTARSLQAGQSTVAGVTAQNLLETSPASWAESDLTLKEPVEMNEGKDRRGPIALGAVATVSVSAPSPVPSPSPEAAESEPAKKTEGRVAAFGDSDFASNGLLGFQGNQDFVLNTVAWLAEESDLISIRPKEPDDQKMFLTQQQQQNVALLALVLIPGSFILLGVASWWRRR